MDYFAGLEISMDETHICVLDREGAVVYECKSASVALVERCFQLANGAQFEIVATLAAVHLTFAESCSNNRDQL
jgi:hypothetical protein